MKKFTLAATLTAAALATVPVASNATFVLTENSGWHYGQDSAASVAQDNAPILFTVTNPNDDLFSFTDGFIPGDQYSIMFQVGASSMGPFFPAGAFTSTFTSYAHPFVDNFGPDKVYFVGKFVNNSFSHFQGRFSIGTYTAVVKNISGKGFPAGFGFRLDSAVPEPATWAMMLFGFALTGITMRRRKGQLTAFA